jgi:hypothetical protein
MPELSLPRPRIAPMSEQAIDTVRRLERLAREMPQVGIVTDHMLHAGLYSRTICIPAGVMITGALIKVATLLIVQGDVIVYADGGPMHLNGYNIVPADAGRKQAFLATTDVHMTAIFPTEARTVEAAEREFTDETELLGSHAGGNRICITEN